MEIEKGITSPSPRQFGGAYPESEAETKALTRLCRIRQFRQCMALHAQGEELYWQYGDYSPPQANMMAKILADSCSYTLVTNAGLASHGGFKDWFISEMKRPGFTLEIGKGENPLPVSELYEIYSRIEEALVLFALM
jgi:g-D-glutamyl-meso-diaminopimelate peptidase